MNSYWDRTLNQRTTRRRAIVTTGVTAGAAAFLAACGGGSDGPKVKNEGALVAPAISTTSKAVKGGTAVLSTNFNPLNLDLNGSGGNVNVRTAGELAYRFFVAWDHGTKDKLPEGKEKQGDT